MKFSRPESGSAFTRFLVVLVILALAGAVGVLLSRINEHTFSLQVSDDKLVVMKGRQFPVGEQPYQPSDPAQRDTYAPIALDGAGAGRLVEQRFTDKEEVDRALFDLLARLANNRITSDEPKTLEQGLYYLHRAEKLSALTEEQRQALKRMQLEVAFYLARSKLDEARRMVGEALAQLKLAGGVPNRHSRSANQMLLEVQPAATALEEALRKAVHSISSPSPEPASPPQKSYQ